MDDLQRQAFEYFGALAFVGIGLMSYAAFVTRQWIAALARIESMHASRLEAEREHGKIGEAMRDTMAANAIAIQAAMDVMRDTGSCRERGA